MLAGHRVSSDRAFTAALKPGRRSAVGKGAVEKALRELHHAGASQAQQTLVVQRFLDSKDASALTAKAREALIAFVLHQGAQSSGPTSGQRLTDVRADQQAIPAARKEANARVVSLLERRSTAQEKRARHAKVSAWLDAADADLAQAGARLAALALRAKAKTG